MPMERAEHTMHARMDAQTAAMRAEAVEWVLAILERAPADVTARDLIARIEWEAIRLPRCAMV
jgi:hypothetical protein